MNKFYLIGILATILLPFKAEATHLHGAQITATAESCKSNTYTITITGYGDSGSEVTFAVGILDLGFGDPVEFGVETDFSHHEITDIGDYSIRVSKLSLDDITFPGPGEYLVTFQTFNRNADAVNVRNSVNTPLYVESKLVVDPLLCNSTPQLTGIGNYLAYTNSTFLQKLGAYDPDGDSLSLELTQQDFGIPVSYLGAPLDIDLRYADSPTNAAGTGLPTFTFDTSTLVWDAPNLPGSFTFALRVNEWRKINGEWQQLGYVTRDLTVQVLDTVNNISFTDIITSTRQEEPEKPKVQLFPNPNQGDFTLDIRDDTWRGATASIHNIIGLEIDQRTVTLGENPYSLPDCQPGIYFLTLRQGDLQQVLRFMKR